MTPIAAPSPSWQSPPRSRANRHLLDHLFRAERPSGEANDAPNRERWRAGSERRLASPRELIAPDAFPPFGRLDYGQSHDPCLVSPGPPWPGGFFLSDPRGARRRKRRQNTNGIKG